MLFKDQAEYFISWIQTRKRRPVRSGTVKIYESYLLSHILPELGDLDIKLIDNGVAKQFVTYLNGLNLAPTTINQVFNLVKSVIASCMDENGNERFPKKWNHDFIDLPIVNPADQDAPIVTPEQIQQALTAARKTGDRQLQATLVLLAASGLRVGELVALHGHLELGCELNPNYKVLLGTVRQDTPLKGTYGFSYWDPLKSAVCVNSTRSNGKDGKPKTESGTREIDLHPDINEFLKRSDLPTSGPLFQNSRGGSIRLMTAYDQLEDVGITEGFHAFRRFRATHLESQNVPRSLTRFWLGHAGQSITDRYIKIGQDLETRQDWAKKAGYGFQLS